jgi:hypothetical protein
MRGIEASFEAAALRDADIQQLRPNKAALDVTNPSLDQEFSAAKTKLPLKFGPYGKGIQIVVLHDPQGKALERNIGQRKEFSQRLESKSFARNREARKTPPLLMTAL